MTKTSVERGVVIDEIKTRIEKLPLDTMTSDDITGLEDQLQVVSLDIHDAYFDLERHHEGGEYELGIKALDAQTEEIRTLMEHLANLRSVLEPKSL